MSIRKRESRISTDIIYISILESNNIVNIRFEDNSRENGRYHIMFIGSYYLYRTIEFQRNSEIDKKVKKSHKIDSIERRGNDIHFITNFIVRISILIAWDEGLRVRRSSMTSLRVNYPQMVQVDDMIKIYRKDKMIWYLLDVMSRSHDVITFVISVFSIILKHNDSE